MLQKDVAAHNPALCSQQGLNKHISKRYDIVAAVHASMYATGTAGRQESAPARHLTAPPALAITKQHVLTLCFWLTTLAKRGLQSSGAILLDRRQGLPRLGQKNSILRALRSDRYYTADWHVNCSPGSLCSPLLHSGVVR